MSVWTKGREGGRERGREGGREGGRTYREPGLGDPLFEVMALDLKLGKLVRFCHLLVDV